MKAIPWLLFLGTAALAFGAWGRFTDAGRTRYDEMAGMIPFGAWYLGVALLAIGALLWLVLYLKS